MNETEGYVAELYCPRCQQKQPVQANMIHMDYVKADVYVFKDHCEVDWENADASGDFEFICDICGNPLAADLEALHNKLNKEISSDSSVVSKM